MKALIPTKTPVFTSKAAGIRKSKYRECVRPQQAVLFTRTSSRVSYQTISRTAISIFHRKSKYWANFSREKFSLFCFQSSFDWLWFQRMLFPCFQSRENNKFHKQHLLVLWTKVLYVLSNDNGICILVCFTRRHVLC